MDSDPLHGKVAIVTGASSGIGRDTAMALAEQGAYVALVARREDTLLKLAEEINGRGHKAVVMTADVTRRPEVELMAQDVFAYWGRVDILVSNAGEYIRRPIIDLDPAEIQRSLDVNFFGGVNCILAVLPYMLEQKNGHIIAVTSMAGRIGIPPDAPYTSAKFAMTGFLEVLRQELRSSGVSVTNIQPGRVDTPMIEHLQFSRVSPKIPSEDVVRAILKSIRRPRPVVIVPPQARLLYYINALAPSLSDRLTRYFRLEGWRREEQAGKQVDKETGR